MARTTYTVVVGAVILLVFSYTSYASVIHKRQAVGSPDDLEQRYGDFGVDGFNQRPFNGFGNANRRPGRQQSGQSGQNSFGQSGQNGFGRPNINLEEIFGPPEQNQFDQNGFGQNGLGINGQTGQSEFGETGFGQNNQNGQSGFSPITQNGQTGFGQNNQNGQTGFGQNNQNGQSGLSPISQNGQTGFGLNNQNGQSGFGQNAQQQIQSSEAAVLACTRSCLATSEYNPVCGSDGRTHQNEGRFQCVNRCRGGTLTIVRAGQCPPVTTNAPGTRR